MSIRAAFAFLLLMASSCHRHSEEEAFYAKPPADRIQRLRGYSLADQYKLFRYGNDKIEPPAMSLAGPIAEKGGAAIPFLVMQLKSTDDDLAVRDILVILQDMTKIGSYDVKDDGVLMDILSAKVAAMRDERWKAVSLGMLGYIKQPK